MFKTLWSSKIEQFAHFDLSPISEEVIWYYSDLPQIMNKETTLDLLLAYLGKNANIPEGIELKTIELKFI